MTALANDTDLKYAEIDLCLFHVNTGILLQLWKGFIVNYTTDGSPQFAVRASDGLYQINQITRCGRSPASAGSPSMTA